MALPLLHIVVDGNAVAHRAWNSLGDLKYDGQNTGTIFGFLLQILKVAELFKTTSFSFAWDSKRSFRRELFPEYKAKRRAKRDTETEKEVRARMWAYRQFGKLRTYILPALGFENVYCVEGLEADDLIASIALNSTKLSKESLYFVSSDEDLYQLLHRATMIKSSNYSAYTMTDLVEDWQCPPAVWANAKALAGCATDEVPGVVGVGMKTAIAFLNGTHVAPSKRQAIAAFPKDLYWRNMQLVKLPFKGTPVLSPNLRGTFDIDGFKRICEEYGFQSFLTGPQARKWEKVFCS